MSDRWPGEAATDARSDATGEAVFALPAPENDVPRLEQIGAELSGVEAALRRLDEGTYGTCQVCGAALDAGVLAADPLAARCPGH